MWFQDNNTSLYYWELLINHLNLTDQSYLEKIYYRKLTQNSPSLSTWLTDASLHAFMCEWINEWMNERKNNLRSLKDKFYLSLRRAQSYTKSYSQLRILRTGQIVFSRKEYNNWSSNLGIGNTLLQLKGCSLFVQAVRKEHKAGQWGSLSPDLLSLACPVCFIIQAGLPSEQWHHPEWTRPTYIS